MSVEPILFPFPLQHHLTQFLFDSLQLKLISWTDLLLPQSLVQSLIGTLQLLHFHPQSPQQTLFLLILDPQHLHLLLSPLPLPLKNSNFLLKTSNLLLKTSNLLVKGKLLLPKLFILVPTDPQLALQFRNFLLPNPHLETQLLFIAIGKTTNSLLVAALFLQQICNFRLKLGNRAFLPCSCPQFALQSLDLGTTDLHFLLKHLNSPLPLTHLLSPLALRNTLVDPPQSQL